MKRRENKPHFYKGGSGWWIVEFPVGLQMYAGPTLGAAIEWFRAGIQFGWVRDGPRYVVASPDGSPK